ncbi:carotenoid oxygenase family protein [Bradyrhizobium sp. USDA 4369]
MNEDDGYLMFTEFNSDRGATDLVILDVRAIKDEALARIHLPIRVPFGVHGSFVPFSH